MGEAVMYQSKVPYRADWRIQTTGNAFAACAGLSRAEMRQKVIALEAAIKQLPAVPEDVHHHFSDGVYARELRIPAGAVITGKTHRKAHLSFLLSGDISVLTEEGIKRIQGPAIVPAMAGIKRAGYAHTDTVWITVHATEETDLGEIERQFIMPDNELIEGKEPLCLGPQQ
jgi:hypothetical protein